MEKVIDKVFDVMEFGFVLSALACTLMGVIGLMEVL